MIPRVVIDTNLYLSALLFGGIPGQLLLLASDGKFLPVISPPLVDELRRKLLTRFNRSPAITAQIIQEILEISSLVFPTETLTACRDPDDNRILECAVAGRADFILTGDKDLLTLRAYQNIPILTARQFLDTHGPNPLS